MAKIFFFVAAILLSFSSIANGLRCWTCQDAKSERECRQIGRSELCLSNQESCQTEVRQHGVSGMRITKSCKQTLACLNNKLQNPSQCRPDSGNSVCRYCCKGNDCNKGSSQKLEKSRCESIAPPQNGWKRCKKGNELGSVCKFSCRRGFRLEGRRTSVCKRSIDKTGFEFNRPTPLCQPIAATTQDPQEATTNTDVRPLPSRCEDLDHSPLNGYRSCKDTPRGRVCEYSCGQDETLLGSEVLTCDSESGWDGEPPLCIPRCAVFPSNPRNGRIHCEGDGTAGKSTKCEFSCDDEYRLDGDRETHCVLSGTQAVWSKETPNCVIIR